MFWRVLKRIGKVVLSLVFIVLVLALVLWQWPGIIVTERNFARVAQRLRPAIDMTWDSLSLTASSVSFFKKKVTLSSGGFCFRMESQRLEVCTKEFSAQAVVDVSRFSPRFDVGPIRLTGGKFRMNPPPQPKEEVPPKEEPSNPLAILDRLTVHDIDTHWESIAFENAGTKITGKADVALRALLAWNLDAKATILTGKISHKAALKLTSAGADLDNVSYRLEATYAQNSQRFQINGDGLAGKNKLTARFNGTAKNLAELARDISLRNCNLAVEFSGEGALPKNLDWECPIIVNGIVAKSKATGKSFEVGKLEIRTKVSASTETQKNKSVWAKTKLDVNIDPIFPAAKSGTFLLKASTEGPLSEPTAWFYEFDTSIDVTEFQKWVRALISTPWAVPAPANVLSGSLRAKASGKGKFLSEGGKIPIELFTRLRSQQQHLDVDTKGELSLGKKNNQLTQHLQLDVALKDVVLVLPYVGIGNVPRLVPDGRIQTEPTRKMAAATSTAPTFTYDIHVETTDYPVRLKSNLAAGDVPIDLRLDVVPDKGPTGQVRISSFPVEMFHRKATIRDFAIRLTDPADFSEVTGSVVVSYSDYKIFIDVLGLLNRPQVKLRSEPPLPQDQVIAVLLFGRKPDELDPDQAQSVGNTRAAVEDGALSLASMYVLASTPVESIGYNRETKTFTAKVSLGEGTTLTVGSNMRQLSSVGIRKSLGGNWAISTTYSKDPFSEVKRSVEAFLEWSKGY